MTSPKLNIVLHQPQIPNNTGNIGRTAMATGCRLHVIHPIGFQMDEKARRRAGLDYWEHVDCREHADWASFMQVESPRRVWCFTTQAARPHWEAEFQAGDYLLFGQENGGLPAEVHAEIRDRFGEAASLRLPMVAHPAARSLNLATVVAVAVYEGLRQFAQRPVR